MAVKQVIIFLSLIFILGIIVNAQNIPHQFNAGGIVIAAQVNDNFQYINDLDGRYLVRAGSVDNSTDIGTSGVDIYGVSSLRVRTLNKNFYFTLGSHGSVSSGGTLLYKSIDCTGQEYINRPRPGTFYTRIEGELFEVKGLYTGNDYPRTLWYYDYNSTPYSFDIESYYLEGICNVYSTTGQVYLKVYPNDSVITGIDIPYPFSNVHVVGGATSTSIVYE